MLESLHTSTMVTGYGLIASPTISTTTGTIKPEKDKKGKTTGYNVEPKGAILPSLVSVGTTASYVGQELHEQHTIESIRDAQAIIESLSDEELQRLEERLTQQALELEIGDILPAEEISEGKAPLAKK